MLVCVAFFHTLVMRREVLRTTGFTLVEMVIVLAVGAIAMTGVASMVNFQMRSTKSVTADLDFSNFQNQVMGVLGNSTSCAVAFHDSSHMSVRLPAVGMSGGVDHIHAPYGDLSSSLSGQKISFQLTTRGQVTGVPNQYFAVLTLTAKREKTANVGGDTKSRTIQLQATVNPSTFVITSCGTSSVASLPMGSSGQTLRHDGNGWLSTGSLFNDGNRVGVGTNAPAAKLDVAGEIRAGDTGLACSPASAGAMRFKSGVMEYCDGAAWKSMAGGGGITAITSASCLISLGGWCQVECPPTYYRTGCSTQGQSKSAFPSGTGCRCKDEIASGGTCHIYCAK